jgi:hypothetical protein
MSIIDFYIYLTTGSSRSNQVLYDRFGLCYKGGNIV